MKNRSTGKWGRHFADVVKIWGWSLLWSSCPSDSLAQSAEDHTSDHYSPPEWNALSIGAQAKLAKSLSWETLSKWDFDMLEVAELTSDPLLLVGWALFCEPMAQEAMNRSLGIDGDLNGSIDIDSANTNDRYPNDRYRFHEHLPIDPRKICNFLREIERRYKHDNPYHNNVHAADVVQTTHSFFQLMDDRHRSRVFDPVVIFSVILAATFHDVGHPGTNNLFQKNAMTQLSIQYNNRSPLESMHSAVGHNLLLGEGKQDQWDIFEGWAHDEKLRAREIMIKCIMATDLSSQMLSIEAFNLLVDRIRTLAEEVFEEKTDAAGEESQSILSIIADAIPDPNSCEDKGVAKKQRGGRYILSRILSRGATTPPSKKLSVAQSKLEEESTSLTDLIITYSLAAADISNVAKPLKLAYYWANCVCDEFFAQGDKEKEMGLPVSPGCNRDTVTRPDSQIGFIKFVVQPRYRLLEVIFPGFKEEVMPLLVNNLEFWEQEKLRHSAGTGERNLVSRKNFTAEADNV